MFLKKLFSLAVEADQRNPVQEISYSQVTEIIAKNQQKFTVSEENSKRLSQYLEVLENEKNKGKVEIIDSFERTYQMDDDTILGITKLIRTPEETVYFRFLTDAPGPAKINLSKEYHRKVSYDKKDNPYFTLNGRKFYLTRRPAKYQIETFEV